MRHRTSDPNTVVDYWTAVQYRYNRRPDSTDAHILCPATACNRHFGSIETLKRHVDVSAARYRTNSELPDGQLYELDRVHLDLQEGEKFSRNKQLGIKQENSDSFKCQYCGCGQSRKDALTRHLEESCKVLLSEAAVTK